ncbi:MAG: HAD family phosphatase [Candidatus Aenigmarchaeota archaeon]|nr:HAD family phosphatase [Candidatus Aenigmarchaeota archaeon]
MIQGILFDMDGVLVDTEPLHCRGVIEALKKYNVILTEEKFYELWTRRGGGIADFVKEKNISADPNIIREEKRKIYRKLLEKELKMYDGVDKTLCQLSEKYPLALVTASRRKDADLILNMTQIKKYFNWTVTNDDVKHRKPDPEGFLLAGKKLNINPENLLVIEDAQKGIIAAHKAGMKSVAIPNKYTTQNDFSLAGKIINSINDLTFDLIENFS